VSTTFENKEAFAWILKETADGQPNSEAELFELTYQQLRKLADHMMSRQAACHTLQATALVNEAMLRFLGGRSLETLSDREHFLAAMAQAMRWVLVDHTRKRTSRKRGGDFNRIQLDTVLDELEAFGRVDILELDEALSKLSDFSERHFDLVQLRFFLGMTVGEIAKHKDVSITTIERDWRFARAWLAEELAD